MDIFQTAVLNRVVEYLDQPASFLLDLAFPEVQTEQGSEEIHFDVAAGKPRITPFVHPAVAGQVVQDHGYTAKSFRPAYAKDKRRFDSRRALKRAIGERIGGSMSGQQRIEAAVQAAIMDQLEMLTRREEVMAAEALRNGQVTVSGERYPTVIVDFGRDAALEKALLTTARWGETGVKPLDDIETWAYLTLSKGGALPTEWVFDPEAWKLFRADSDVRELIKRDGGLTESDLVLAGRLRSQGQAKAAPMGRIGQLRFWVYQDNYIDDAGVEQKLMPDYTVLGIAPMQVEGVRAYGMILDEEANYEATRYFSKSWLEKDPSVRWLMLQSAPLVVPYRPNATFRALVHDGT